MKYGLQYITQFKPEETWINLSGGQAWKVHKCFIDLKRKREMDYQLRGGVGVIKNFIE